MVWNPVSRPVVPCWNWVWEEREGILIEKDREKTWVDSVNFMVYWCMQTYNRQCRWISGVNIRAGTMLGGALIPLVCNKHLSYHSTPSVLIGTRAHVVIVYYSIDICYCATGFYSPADLKSDVYLLINVSMVACCYGNDLPCPTYVCCKVMHVGE